MGRKSLFTVALGFLGTGVIIDFFHRAGTVRVLSVCWNIGHHAVVSCSAQLLGKKSWQAIRAYGLARTYSTIETSDAVRVNFQAVSGRDCRTLSHS